VTAVAEARLPWALNTVVATAIPNTAPNCCMVFSTPAALPSDDGLTAFRPAAETDGRAIEMPMPAMRSGAT
jgi:hypothetical protein